MSLFHLLSQTSVSLLTLPIHARDAWTGWTRLITQISRAALGFLVLVAAARGGVSRLALSCESAGMEFFVVLPSAARL